MSLASLIKNGLPIKNVKVDGYSVADHLTTPKATSLLYKCLLSNIQDGTVDSMASGSRTKMRTSFISQ